MRIRPMLTCNRRRGLAVRTKYESKSGSYGAKILTPLPKTRSERRSENRLALRFRLSGFRGEHADTEVLQFPKNTAGHATPKEKVSMKARLPMWMQIAVLAVAGIFPWFAA